MISEAQTAFYFVMQACIDDLGWEDKVAFDRKNPDTLFPIIVTLETPVGNYTGRGRNEYDARRAAFILAMTNYENDWPGPFGSAKDKDQG